MSLRVHAGLICLGALLVGCSGPSTQMEPARAEVAPQDFALLPCGQEYADRPCTLVVAGGKRVLFGAPAGTAASLAAQDLRLLDAVILFSLHAGDLEGLDEIRNESWRAGRDRPLLVIGPSGTIEVAQAIDKAFEQADALRIVEEGIPPGGYDAAVLNARIWQVSQTIFDTGDLKVMATRGGFQIDYNAEARAQVWRCGFEPQDIVESADFPAVRLGCDSDTADHVWPLTAPIFIVKN